ncbi:cardb domain protein (plasmid) [Bacillus cereus H3081.97]|nr:cardb domain protein [Bacillus cereus H3081.97]MEC0069187.1 CARDB domain-containing protein [Bacillus cereus]
MKHKILKVALSSLIVSSIFQYPVKEAHAEKQTTRWIHYGEIQKDMRWENPKIVPYPNQEYGDYPDSITYDQDGQTGILKATRIKLTPKEKVHHKDGIYRTETKEFTKTVSNTYHTNDQSLVPKEVTINEDGYQGKIPLVGNVEWSKNWETNRTVNLDGHWEDNIFRRYSWQAPAPSSISKNYYDERSGQTLNFQVPQSGDKYSVDSKGMWIQSRSEGRAEYYDGAGNSRLGFMSYNPYTYYGDMYNFSDSKPLKPDTYYGLEPDKENWIVEDWGWDEWDVQDAEDPRWHYKTAQFGYRWKSESGRTNRYRKGVWIDYIKQVQGYRYAQEYRGTFNLPDILKDFTGKATYKGKLSKEVFDHWNEYDTSGKWDVEVEYVGDIRATNLKAQSITILDSNNKAINHLVKGKEYKAKVDFINDGELDVKAFKIAFYQDNKKLQTIDIKSMKKGEKATKYFTFKAEDSGDHTFRAKVDDENVIKEINENDNEVSTTPYVNTVPKIELKYNPNPVFEGDNVTLEMLPSDEDPRDKEKLQVILEMKENQGNWKKVFEEKKAISGKTLQYKIDSIKDGSYEFKATVTDPHGEKGEAKVSFKAEPLSIKGKVDHTKEWQEIHKKLNHLPEQFVSGEKFVTSAIVTNYPIEFVTLEFKGMQVNKQDLIIRKPLNSSHPIYNLDIFEPSMTDPRTKLEKGNIYFMFTAKWKNGIIKRDIVTVEIIEDAYNTFDFYRTN